MRVVLLLLTALLLLMPHSPGRQLVQAEVTPEQATYAIAAGAETTISILLQNASNVYGIDARASFDPALVEVIDADAASEGVQVEPGEFPKPDFIAVNTVEPQAGTLRYVVTQVNPTPPANGSGLLFTVRLRGKGVAGQGTFAIETVEISDRNGNLLPVSVGSAALVVSGSSETPVPAAATGVAIAPTSAAIAQPTATPLPTISNTTAATLPAQPAATEATEEEATGGSGVTPIGTVLGQQTIPSPTETAAPDTEEAPPQPSDEGPADTAQPERVDEDGAAEEDTAIDPASTPTPSALGESPVDAVADLETAPEPEPNVAVIGDSQAMPGTIEMQSAEASAAAPERSLGWPIVIGVAAVLALVVAVLLVTKRSN